jgi:hypothetical protein
MGVGVERLSVSILEEVWLSIVCRACWTTYAHVDSCPSGVVFFGVGCAERLCGHILERCSRALQVKHVVS